MRSVTLILLLLTLLTAEAQTRNDMIYASVIKFPNSQYDLALGWDHAFQITKRKFTAARLYFVLSPNLLWSGYDFDNSDGYPQTKFEKYEIALPLHIRFELAPFRVAPGRVPGGRNTDFAVFFDAGISVNYLVGAHLYENFSNDGLPFIFDGSITSTISNKLTAHYLTFNMGCRIRRFALILRAYQPFVDTRYKNLSAGWGLPAGLHSFFYDKWLVDPFYKQGTVLLCFAYSL